MKTFIPMFIIFLAVAGLCIWDGIFTHQVFKKMEADTSYVYETLQVIEITDENLQEKIFAINDYWTDKMDLLAVSISRKDMQPVSDYLQYLCASIKNESQEDAITYSRLLKYNVEGLKEMVDFNGLNLL